MWEGGEQPTDGGGTSGAITLGFREVVAGAHRNQRRRLAQGDDAGQCGLLERGLRRPLPRPRHRCRHHHWAPGHTDCHRHRNATRCQRTPTPKHSWPASNKGSRIDAQRKAIVEPLNGQIKGTRGLRRFLLPSLEKVDAEWHLIAATHNPLKLFRFQRSQQQALAEQQQDEGKRPWKSGQS